MIPQILQLVLHIISRNVAAADILRKRTYSSRTLTPYAQDVLGVVVLTVVVEILRQVDDIS